MNNKIQLYLCKSLNKRSYEYKGGEFNKAWKLKEKNGDVLYDTYEDFLKAKEPKKPAPKKPVVKKKVVATKKER